MRAFLFMYKWITILSIFDKIGKNKLKQCDNYNYINLKLCNLNKFQKYRKIVLHAIKMRAIIKI